MKTKIATGVVLAAAWLFASAQVYADCTLYDYSALRGDPRSLGAGERLGNLGARWDNRTSSVDVSNNCKLTLYSDANFRGDSKVINASTHYLGSLWDNQASSAMCTCPPPPPEAGGHHRRDNRHGWHRPPPPTLQACRLYREMDFGGGELQLSPNNSYGDLGYGMNDQSSSVKVPVGCSLTVYSRDNLTGRSKVFLEGDYNFVGEHWNDRISSAECPCR